MKKFSYYVISWITFVALFSYVTYFLNERISESESSFWVGYGFVMLSFVGHLIYSYFVFSEKNQMKEVLNIPVVVLSFIELGVMTCMGIICMLIQGLPKWLGGILCAVILACSVMLLVFVRIVGERTYGANMELNDKVSYLRKLVDGAQILVNRADNEEIKKMATQVYEALRYSDLTSSEVTRNEENLIEEKLEILSGIIEENTRTEEIKKQTTELLTLIQIRSNKLKQVKTRI